MDVAKVIFQFDRRASAKPSEVRFVRMKEVVAICGKSRSGIYKAIKAGDFPKPVKVDSRSSAWIRSEIEQWAQRRIQASRPEHCERRAK
jgi:prophage regulatory protein